MSKTQDGGQAFPRTFTDSSGATYLVGGMSLRDKFADTVIGAMLVNAVGIDKLPDEVLRAAARQAWRVADAMIAERFNQ